MQEKQQRTEPADPTTTGDYGYDLAHDEPDAERGVEPDEPRAPEPVEVVTETEDLEGDYGYDLAHDIPRHE